MRAQDPSSSIITRIPGTFLVQSRKQRQLGTVLCSDVSLSFWGGIHPETGIIIDTSHPLHTQCVSDTYLCLPSGRGSCTASQVLLELLRNDGVAPKGILLRDVDGLLAVGALVADEIFAQCHMDIVWVGKDGFDQLLLQQQQDQQQQSSSSSMSGIILSNGDFVFGNNQQDLTGYLDTAAAEEETISPDTPEPNDTMSIQFTEEERQMLQECDNEAKAMALRVIFRYAHVMRLGQNKNNDHDDRQSSSSSQSSYKPITRAHIDGCTYIGPGGLEFAQRLVHANGRVHVPTTLNSGSADRRRWQALGVPSEYAHNAIALGDAYTALGCQPSFTCAPYLLDAAPALGDDICWGESNAVVFANTVLGARTEKYADYLDICCSLAGIVPGMGVHLEENRVPAILLDARELIQELLEKEHQLDDAEEDADTAAHKLNLDAIFPILGHVCGSKSDGRLPLLVGLEEWADRVSRDNLKAFCAAFGTTGTSPLIHIAGITPEALDPVQVKEWKNQLVDRTVSISLSDLEQTFALLDKDSSSNHPIDLIALGNPHLSLSECQQLAEMIHDLNNAKKHEDVRVIACMSRDLYKQAETMGYVPTMKAFGIEFINDTCWCMLLDPPVIPTKQTTATLTNSGKYAHYGPGLTARPFRFASTADCMAAAVTGRYPRQPHSSPNGKKNTTKNSWFTYQSPASMITKRSYGTASCSTNQVLRLVRRALRR